MQTKQFFIILSLWSFSFSLSAQQSDCNYMKGLLEVKGILHPTCFAACDGKLLAAITFQGGLGGAVTYYIDGQKSLSYGLFLDICPGRHTIIGEMEMDGCRDTIHVLMTPLDSTHTTLKKTICNGQGYVLNNQILTKSGTYQAAFPRKNTCDSAAVLHLKVLPSDTVRVEKIICKGAGSSGTIVLKKSNGCDSVIPSLSQKVFILQKCIATKKSLKSLAYFVISP
jgi:hypothetical protein